MTVKLIQETTISTTGTRVVDFNNIPQDYDDLVIKIFAKSLDTSTIYRGGYQPFGIKVNGLIDSTDYATVSYDAFGSGNDQYTNTIWSNAGMRMFGGFQNSYQAPVEFGQTHITVPNYRSTGYSKSFIGQNYIEGNVQTKIMSMSTGISFDTNPITRLEFTITGSEYAIGSVFALYGVKKRTQGENRGGNYFVDFLNGVDGYTFTNGCTLSASDSLLKVEVTNNDPHWGDLAGLSFYGEDNRYIQLKIRKSNPEPFANYIAQVFYATTSHGISGSYKNSITDQPVWSEDFQILEFDMYNSSDPSDWRNSVITGLRFDIPSDPVNLAGETYYIDWIRTSNKSVKK